jgi:hypothetical protein
MFSRFFLSLYMTGEEMVMRRSGEARRERREKFCLFVFAYLLKKSVRLWSCVPLQDSLSVRSYYRLLRGLGSQYHYRLYPVSLNHRSSVGTSVRFGAVSRCRTPSQSDPTIVFCVVSAVNITIGFTLVLWIIRWHIRSVWSCVPL